MTAEQIVEQIGQSAGDPRFSWTGFQVFGADRNFPIQVQDFQPVQGSAASSSDLPGQAGQGVFRTFPQNKKSATQPPHSRSELPPHSSSWTPAPYDASMVLEEEEEEERRSARRTLRWSTWSTTGACGGASGFLLASGTAGGWPLPMGHRLVMSSGGRRGSSAQGQGEVGTTVDTWSASVPVLMPYFSSFYVKVNSDPEVVFLALWRVGVHAEWRSAHSRSFSFPCLHLEFGQYVMRPLVSGSSCSLFGVWRNAWFDKGYMFCVSRMAFGSISQIFYVIGWTRLLRSILLC